MNKYVFAFVFAVILVVPAFLYPNVFGNQPDAIADESYFLTSVLSSLQKHTLPGWEFSASGAYYGGVQTYIDTLTLIPVLTVEFFIQGHTLINLQMWAANNTGVLIHALRLVNGFSFLTLLFVAFWYSYKRQIPLELAHKLVLLTLLILSCSIIVMFFHTAKVWGFYLIFEIIIGILVLAQEFYVRHQNKPFLPTQTYIGFLLWLGALAFFQTFVGAFTAGLWILWAWWLGHFCIIDVWMHVRRWWYLFVIFALTQISFVWRAFFARSHGSILDIQGARASGDSIDWAHRFLAPLHDAILGQPFILLYFLLLLLLLIPAYRNTLKPKRYTAIAIIHPILVYLFFYPLLGFDLSPRYAAMFILACSFSIVMLLPKGKPYVASIVGSLALAFIVLVHSSTLYWHSSFQKDVTNQLRNKIATQAYVIDVKAIGFSLPLNSGSLLALDSEERSKSRYAFLLGHLSQVDSVVSFKPLVMYTHSDQERKEAIELTQKAGKEVSVIFHNPYDQNTAEPATLFDFLQSTQLGTPYKILNLPQ